MKEIFLFLPVLAKRWTIHIYLNTILFLNHVVITVMKRVPINQIRSLSTRPPGISSDEFSGRRKALINLGKTEFKQKSNVAAVIKGASRQSYAPHVYYPFKQSSYFRYLSGVVVPDSLMYIDDRKSTLFIKETDDYSALWDGCRYSNDDLKKISGVDEIIDIKEFENFLAKNIQDKNLIFEADDFKNMPIIELMMKRPQSKLTNLVDQLRWIKSPAEMELMRRTCEVGSEAMNQIIRESKYVPNEAHICGRLEFEYRRRGTSGAAYPPVIAAGERANTIHYIDSDQVSSICFHRLYFSKNIYRIQARTIVY